MNAMKAFKEFHSLKFFLIYIIFLFLFVTPIFAALPSTINYQGYLTDSDGKPISDTMNVTFRLYPTIDAVSEVWSESQAVTVGKGLFDVELDVSGILPQEFENALFLGVQVEGESEMLPRKPVTLTAYAIKAEDANSVNGVGGGIISSHVNDTTTNPHNVNSAQTGADAALASHTSNSAAHHSKTTSFTEISDTIEDGQIPESITRDQELKDHQDNASAHHSKTTRFSELTDQATDAQIPDSITINQAKNADTLDGHDSSEFMSSGADNWVNTAGDTMTGTLKVLARVGIGTSSPSSMFDTRGNVSGYLGYFINEGSTTGSAYGLYTRGDARDTGTGTGYGASLVGYGGSVSGSAYGSRNYAYAFGSSNAYGVYSNATGGSTTGEEWAFYGIGDGYISNRLSIGSTETTSPLAVYGSGSYLGRFYNNNSSGNSNGILVRSDSSDASTATSYGGVFYAFAGSTTGDAHGVISYAYAHGTSSAYGVYSNGTYGSTTGDEYAFYGIGDAHITGTLSKGAGSFKIDHPLDPENKYLQHSFVESPDMKNIYDGVVVLDENGEATISMPEWFNPLNRDFRYQLTCIGGFAQVYIAEEISNNQFKIAGGKEDLKVSWMVTGIRQDAYANANRIPVEENKEGVEIGTYLHPEVFGQIAERGLAKVLERDLEK